LERRISESKRQFLSDESQKWVEDGVISAAQRGGILGCYVVKKTLPTVVLTLGVCMIGTGVLTFIAANWQALPSWFKIALIIGSYASSVGGAYVFERRGMRNASDALLLLSGFLLMGGTALMSQVFHTQGSVTGLLATWLLAFAPTFLIVQNISIYILYEIIAIAYMNILYIEHFDEYRNYSYDTAAFPALGPIRATLAVALLVGAAWWVWSGARKKSRTESSKLKNFFVGGATRRIFWSNFLVVNWFTWICVMNGSDRSILPYIFGVLIIGGAVTLMAWRLDAGDLDWQGLLLVGISAMSLTFPAVWDTYSYRYSYSGDLNVSSPAVFSSLLLGAYLVFRIIRRQRGGGFATFLFCALLARWYFDVFYSFMSKSLFFVSGGVIMLGVAYAYRKWHKASDKPELPDAASEEISGGGEDE
jgi:uncharacterized membrane protein